MAKVVCFYSFMFVNIYLGQLMCFSIGLEDLLKLTIVIGYIEYL